MNQKEAVSKYQYSWIKSDDEKTQEFIIASYQQFLKYGTQNTLNALWSNFPKILGNDDKKIDEFNKIETLIALQKLETLLYKEGIAALKNDFQCAKVLDYVQLITGEIRYLKVSILLQSVNKELEVIEEWKYDDNNKLQFNYDLTKSPNLSKDDAINTLKNLYAYKPIKYDKIPYVIFFNNASKKGDLELVNGEYFALMDKDLSVLMEDSYISAPWIFSTDGNAVKDQIKKGLKSMKERVITINPQLALYDSQPMHLLQGSPQSQTLIQKIEKNITWIKKFAYMKSDTADMGTKNLHNAEVQEINSDFEDYIEAKANLREIQLTTFFNKFYAAMNVKEIIICGSTKWLTTEARKYAVDKNGVLLNQNQTPENIIDDFTNKGEDDGNYEN